MDGELMYSNIVQIIDFISKSLCFKNGSWISSFGKLTWPRISNMIISNFLAKVCGFLMLNSGHCVKKKHVTQIGRRS